MQITATWGPAYCHS